MSTYYTSPVGTCPGGISVPSRTYKHKTVAALLALLFGGFGIHRFYLGQRRGLFYLVFFWTLIPSLIALAEFIVFLTASDSRWDQAHNLGHAEAIGNAETIANKEVGTRLVISLAIAAFALVFFLGTLAAVVVPAYQDYSARAEIAKIGTDIVSVKRQIEDYYLAHDAVPSANESLGLDSPIFLPGNHRLFIANGNMIVQVNSHQAALAGKQILFRVDALDGSILWVCQAQNIAPQYLPVWCR